MIRSSSLLLAATVCGVAFYAAYSVTADRLQVRTSPAGEVRLASQPAALKQVPLPVEVIPPAAAGADQSAAAAIASEVAAPAAAEQPSAQSSSGAAASQMQPEEVAPQQVAANPYSEQSRREALLALVPGLAEAENEAEAAEALARHREEKFNSYLQQAAISTIEAVSPAPPRQPAAETRSDRGSAASAAEDPYRPYRVAAETLPPPTPEEIAIERERRAERFALYIENARRSQ